MQSNQSKLQLKLSRSISNARGVLLKVINQKYDVTCVDLGNTQYVWGQSHNIHINLM